MAIPDWPTVQPRLGDPEQAIRELQIAVRGHALAKFNCYVDVSLAVSPATSTVVDDPRLHDDCVLLFDPLDAAAAAELASGSLYVLAANRVVGQVTITHSASASARAFRMVILS